MTRRKTDGERIAKRVFSGRYESRGEAFPSELAVEIDRLVRRRMAEARAEVERMRALLRDPNAVAVNMLRGVIALPSADQIRHIYQQTLQVKL